MISMRIKQLSPLLINQIAAGEIISRPASVIKELLENSIDAKSQKIDITCQHGGTTQIRVQDDGHGIHPQDLSLAISSHATSKIAAAEDLHTIMSLGFRGEALASIASVSQLIISSRIATQDHGWTLTVEPNSTISSPQACAHPPGTTITISDLFFNVPVRRKFLRSPKTEFFHIEQIVKKLALSNFEIAIRLNHNSKLCLQLPAARDDSAHVKRIGKIFGKNFLQHARFMDVHATNLRIHGWLAPMEVNRSSNDQQFFYLNGRMIKDRIVQHAIRMAYEDQIIPDRYPCYCLNLTMDPSEVDVNVHPIKHEVRFQNARHIHDFIFTSLNKILTGKNVISFASITTGTTKSTDKKSSSKSMQDFITVTESTNNYDITGIAQQRYLLFELETGIAMLDCLAAEKQYVKQMLQKQYDEDNIITKPLLLPKVIEFLPKNTEKLIMQNNILQKFGINIERLSDNSIVVRNIPAVLTHIDPQLFLQQSLSILQNSQPDVLVTSILDLCAQQQAQAWLQYNRERKLTLADWQPFIKRYLNCGIIPLNWQRKPIVTLIKFSILHQQ